MQLRFWFTLCFTATIVFTLVRSGEAAVPRPLPKLALPTVEQAAPTDADQTAPRDLKDPAWQRWATLPRAVQAKIDPRILAELSGQIVPVHLGGAPNPVGLPAPNPQPLQQTRFLVYLRDQTDPAALQNMVFASQVDQRTALFDLLVNTAQTAQLGVRSLLDAQVLQNDTTAYQSFYLVNAMGVEGGLSTLIALAEREDVAHIAANYPLVTLANEFTPVQQATPQTDEVVQAAQLDPVNWNIDLVNADQVWTELGVNGTGAVVAGFDTGVDYTHPALVQNYRGNRGNGQFDHNYNWFEPNSTLYPNGNLGASASNQPYDCQGHGTHTMGTSVGNGNSAGTQIGMAPSATWIALPGICYTTMPGGIRDDIGALKAFQWLFCPTDLTGNLASADCSKAPDVVNNSWGSANPVNDVLRPAIQKLRAAGIAPVFASGNPSAGPGSIGTPANAPEAITVGATDRDDVVTYFSGRGPSFYEGEQKPELSAPGMDVVSSVPGGDYGRSSGTSMAAPHVTGLIALLVSADLQDGVRDFTVDELEHFMTATARDLGTLGADDDYGYGRIDAYHAVRWVLSAGDLRGTVRDAVTGLPIAGAAVSGLNSDPKLSFSAPIGAGGVYSLTVPAGDYTVRVDAWGYESATFGGQKVFAGTRSIADFALRPLLQATLSGFVRNNGAPISDALVYVANQPSTQTRTQADGSYTLTLPSGEHELVVQAPNQRVLRSKVTVGNTALAQDFALQTAPSILLVDADAAGGWFSGWSVTNIFRWALDKQNYPYEQWAIQYTNITDTVVLADGSTGYGIPSVPTLQQYDVVIWAHHGCTAYGCFTGGSPAAIDADDTLAHYLDQGGRLILSGQDIGSDEDGDPLFDDYLHADHELDVAGVMSDTIAGTGFLQDLTLKLTNAGLYGHANGSISPSPDGVTPQVGDGTAFPILTYTENGSAAALAIDSCAAPYRVLYFAVGYENIGPRASQRDPAIAEVLGRSVEWVVGQKPTFGISLLGRTERLVEQPGNQADYSIQVLNTGRTTTTVQLSLEGNRWPTRLLDPTGAPASQTFVLGPCQSLPLTLVVDIPVQARADEENNLTVGATLVESQTPVPPLTLTTVAFPDWQIETPMLAERYGADAAALPGTSNLYLIGGLVKTDNDSTISQLELSNANERYNSCTQRWDAMQPLPEARAWAGVAALAGKIYVVGGFGSNESDPFNTNSIERATVFVYNPTANSWDQAASLPAAYTNMAVAAANGKLYALGGRNAYLSSNKTFAYDPATNKWQEKAPIPASAGTYVSAAELNGKIYVASGDSESIQIYDPATNLWHKTAPLQRSHFDPRLAAANGFLYLLSSSGSNNINQVDRYAPSLDRWESISTLNDPHRYGTTLTYAAGRVFALGGEQATTSTESLAVDHSFCLSSITMPQNGIVPGERITYTVDINSDRVELGAIELRNPLPANTRFAGFVTNIPGASYNAAQHQVEWQGGLAANSDALSFTYALDAATTGWTIGARVSNTVSFSNGAGEIFNRTATGVVMAVDLTSSAKTVDRAMALGGDEMTYQINLRGRTFAGGPVTVLDPLPASVEYVADSLAFTAGSGQYDPATRSIHWAGVIPSGQHRFVNSGNDYIWGDSNNKGQVSAVQFNWLDIGDTGVSAGRGDERYRCDLPIGFTFDFYGNRYTTFCISTNGFISFDPLGGPDAGNDCPLPQATGNAAIIAAMWTDLYVLGDMTYQTFGVAPNRYLVVQWDDAYPFFSSSTKAADFQLILHENGTIRVQVLHADDYKGRITTTGIESANGKQGITYACREQGTLNDKLAVLFIPPGGGGGQATADIAFRVRNATGLGVNTPITNTATITTLQGTLQRSATAIINSVDLRGSTAQVNKAEANAGDTVEYEFVLRNSGLLTATNATLNLALPTLTTYVADSLICSSGACTLAGVDVQWSGTLAPSVPVTIRFTVRVNAPTADRTPVQASAQVNDGFGNQLALPTYFLARRSDLSASQLQFIPAYGDPGDDATLVLYVRNMGTLETDAQLQFSLPTGLLFDQNALVCGTGNCSYAGGTVQWSGALGARSVVPIRLPVTIPPTANYGDLFVTDAQVKDLRWGGEYTLTASLWVAHSVYLPAVAAPGGQSRLYLPILAR